MPATPDQFPLPLQGQCRCGQLRYRVSQAPLFSYACHCTDCQQLTASAFSLGLAVPAGGFTTEGETHASEKTADSGGWSRRFTCPTCAVWTHTRTEHAPDIAIVRPGTLQDHGWFRPVAQLFTRSAYPWALMPLQLSYEAEFPDPAALRHAFAAAIRPVPAA